MREVYKYNLINVRYGNEKDANSLAKTLPGLCQVDEGGVGLVVDDRLPRITTNCRPCCCAQVFWQRATSDLDLINSEVGLTAKHQARAGGKARQGKESRRFPLRNREGDGRSRRAAHSFNCGCRAVCWGKL